MRDRTLRAPSDIPVNAVAAGSFEGVWREAQVRLTRRDGTVLLIRPTTSLYVATATHYSTAATLAESDTGKVFSCDRFWATSGRYHLAHDTLTMNPSVGHDAFLAAGDSIRFHVRTRRDSLWLDGPLSEHYQRVNERFVPDTASAFVAQEILLVRVPWGAPSRAGAIPGGYDGVWRILEVRVKFQDTLHVIHQDPSLSLATRSHYSVLAVLGYKDPATTKPCALFYGNSGRYELSGDTLTHYPVVAKDPDLPAKEMDGERYLVKAMGDTLWMKWLNAPFQSHEALFLRIAR